MKAVYTLIAFAILAPYALAISACTASQAFVVSGDSLHLAAQQFVIAEKGMREGVQTGKISHADFRKWATFSEKYALFYGMTVDAWKRAQLAGDKIKEGKLAAALAEIGAELLGFYSKLRDAHLLPAGAP